MDHREPSDQHLASACVYTTLFGRYEELNEQPVRSESRLRFICFTDDPDLRSETWEMVLVRPLFGMDPVRSQRLYKMLPHRFLPEHSASLYIDNSVILRLPPERLLEEGLSGCDFALPSHSYRDTVLDEFLEVVRVGFDDSTRVFEQLNHYALARPEILGETPYWCGMLLRRHDSPRLQAAMELWLAHVFRYSRRDQLSLNYCCRAAGLEPRRLFLDNYSSEWHQWPVSHDRDREKGIRSLASSLVPIQYQLQQLQRAHEEMERALKETRELLQQESVAHHRTQELLEREIAAHMATRQTLDRVQRSWTWRATEPIRRGWHLLGRGIQSTLAPLWRE